MCGSTFKTSSLIGAYLYVGDSGVGKTAFVVRLCENRFNPEYTSTLGLDIVLKHLNIRNKIEIRVEIWDTAGQERLLTYRFYHN